MQRRIREPRHTRRFSWNGLKEVVTPWCLLWLMATVTGGCSGTVSDASRLSKAPTLQSAGSPSVELEEFKERGGVPNFFSKLRPGAEVNIAYIGGSITEAREGWRDLTFGWFRTMFPQTKFNQINAAIGGTGSGLGVFRMEQDVLSKKPDLVFVEFAVNDHGGTPAAIHRAVEGIIRKTWKQDPETDICMVYTLAENGVSTLRSGRFQNSALAMESLAEHYQIPSIHMGVEVIRLLEQEKLVFTGIPEEHPGKIVFTRDRTHPLSASGHPIYANAVIRNFQRMSGNAKAKPHTLSTPYISDNWEDAKMVSLKDLARKTGWRELPSDHVIAEKFQSNMPYLYEASGPAASFTIRFRGRALGIYDVIGPNSGIVDVVVDRAEPFSITRFDGWCNNYRKNAFFLKDLKEGEHEVTFTLSDRAVDKEAILAKRKITMDQEAGYDKTGWFVNNILLVGDVLE